MSTDPHAPTDATVLLAHDGTAAPPPALDDDWQVLRVTTAAAARDRLATRAVDCIVAAGPLADASALDLLAAVRERSAVPVVLRPADPDRVTASRAVRLDVDAFVPPGEDGESVRGAVARVLDDADDGDHDDGRAENGQPPGESAWTRPLTTFDGAADERAEVAGGAGGGWGEAVERWETIAEALDDVIWTVDADGRVTYVNATGTDVYGIPQSDVLGAPIFEVFEGIEWGDPADGRALETGIAALLDGECDAVRRRVTLDDAGVTLDVNVVPLTGDGGVVGAAGINRDVTAQRRHERRITALHATARRLLEAESREEIARTTVQDAADVLALCGVVVYRYDPAANELVPAAHTDGAEELYGGLARVGPGEGITGRAFLADETTVYDDVHDSEHLLDGTVPLRSALFVPLGEHGVFVAGAPEVEAFDEADVEHAELLAATAEATLDRASRADALAERERTLGEQRRRVDRLEDVNDSIRRVLDAVLRGDSREELERTVCERLVASDRFAFAWVGDADGDGLRPRARAGTGGEYLDRVTAAGAAAATPAGRAAADRERVTVPNVAAEPTEEWRRAALNEDLCGVVAIPLEYDRVDYGVLAVYAETADVLDDLTLSVLDLLGTAVAYAISTFEQRSALLSEHRVECEFRVDGADDDLAAVAGALDTDLDVRTVTLRQDGRYNAYASVPGDAATAVDGLAADRPGVHEAEVVTAGEPARVRVVVDAADVWERVSAAGARPESVTVAGDGSARPRVSLPASTDVGDYTDRLDTAFADVSLAAKRQYSASPRGSLEERVGLTDRQREVLAAAYNAGFFESPRACTGEEVAEALDVSQPTFLDHLRTSERKLVSAFLDPDPAE